MRVEREHLKHKGDVPLGGRQLADLFSIQVNLAGGRQLQPCNHSQGCGLAAARRPQQHKEFAILNGERAFLHRVEIAEILADVFDDYLRHGVIP